MSTGPKSRRFGKRTWRYLAPIWIGAIVLELVVLELARRTNNSWVLLLGVALLVVPLVATERTFIWLRRAPRKRWKRHDLEDEITRRKIPPARAVNPERGQHSPGENPTQSDDNKPDNTLAAFLKSNPIPGAAHAPYRIYQIMAVEMPSGPVLHIMDAKTEQMLDNHEAASLLEQWCRARSPLRLA